MKHIFFEQIYLYKVGTERPVISEASLIEISFSIFSPIIIYLLLMISLFLSRD